jgi:hypothetical protein
MKKTYGKKIFPMKKTYEVNPHRKTPYEMILPIDSYRLPY